MRHFVLLPSVLLGPPSMHALAGSLRRARRPVVIANTDGAQTPDQVATRYRDSLTSVGSRSVTWIAHSNAGLYLPRILHDRPQDVGVFVDASLPGEGPPYLSASGDRLRAVRNLADASGLVPAWVDWWDRAQLTELLPEEAQRRALRLACPRLPLAYFTTEIDVGQGWHDITAGYLSFDGGYVGERERVAAMGWPTRHLSAGHLGLLTHPEDVAEAVLDLEEQLRAPDWHR